MRQILSYNIHDIVKFQIIRDRKFDFRDLINLKFSCFQVNEIDKPDIVLNIGKFTPANNNCYLVDHKYFVKDNYFYCQDSGRKASWEVEIIGFEEGDVIINFNLTKRFQLQPINATYMLLFLPQAFLFRIIEHKLSTKGCFLAHSGAVSKDNKAYLLCGRAGCFKTTLCMEFVRRAGFTWLGDERVIVYKDKVLGFPMNSLMFEFMTRHLPDETHWDFLRQIRFVAECLFDKHRKASKFKVECAGLRSILLIAKNNALDAEKGITFFTIPQSQLRQIVDSLLTSNRLEDFKGLGGFSINSAPFLRYMLAYTFIFPNSSIVTQERRMVENLRNSLEKIPIYKVEIPSNYSLDIFNQIHDFIMEEN